MNKLIFDKDIELANFCCDRAKEINNRLLTLPWWKILLYGRRLNDQTEYYTKVARRIVDATRW